MIPATQPHTITGETKTFDQWTPVGLSGGYGGPGRFGVTVRLHRSRVIDPTIGNTELSPDPADGLDVSVPDIYAPVSDAYPAGVRSAVLAAVGAIVGAVVAVGTARGVL